MNRLPLLASLVVAGLGCSPRNNGTMLLVQVRTDLAVPQSIDRVDIQAGIGQGAVGKQVFDVPFVPADGILARVALVPEGDPSAEVRVTAAGLKGTVTVVSQTAVVRFEAGQAQMIDIWLKGACASGVSCPSGNTCVEGKCVPESTAVSPQQWTGDGGLGGAVRTDAQGSGGTGSGGAGSGGVAGSGGLAGSDGGIGAGGGPGAGGSSAASLRASTDSLPPFGSVAIGRSSNEASFTIVNQGRETSGLLTLASTNSEFKIGTGASGDCASGLVLTGGQSCTVRVTFSPGVAGDRFGYVTFATPSSGSGNVTVTGTGITPAALGASSTGLTFAGTAVGKSSAEQSFTITNNGGETTSAISVGVGGTNAAEFIVQAGSAGDCVSGTTTLASGASCTVRVVFKPTATGGRSASAAVSAVTGGGGGVPLAGTGITPAALGTTSTGLTFPSTAVGKSSAEQSFTIKNGGEETSSAITVGVGGTNAGDFVVQSGSAGDCVPGSTTLLGGASCTVRVVFAPGAAGARSASATFSAATGGSGSVPLAGTGDGCWTPAGAMATGRRLHTATLLPTGKVLVVGGLGTTEYLASAELHDPASGTWTSTGAMATGRAHHTATLLPSGKVLVVGGHSGSGYLASAELYDPTSGTWTSTGALATRRGLYTATLLSSGKVLVVGGLSDSGVLAGAELYDPASGTWTSTGAAATGRYGHAATLLASGKVLVLGGNVTMYSYLANAELYDPASGTWTTTGALKTGRGYHTVTLLASGKVLVAGGQNSSGNLASAELYDPASGTWTVTGALATARRYHTATPLASGKVLVAGGLTGSGNLASAELYDPASGGWTAAEGLTMARGYHTATLLQSGNVLVAGGATGSTDLASAELYRP